jgi:hypothetical protein
LSWLGTALAQVHDLVIECFWSAVALHFVLNKYAVLGFNTHWYHNFVKKRMERMHIKKGSSAEFRSKSVLNLNSLAFVRSALGSQEVEWDWPAGANVILIAFFVSGSIELSHSPVLFMTSLTNINRILLQFRVQSH